MKEYKVDTSETYDDMVGFIADENLPIDLSVILGEESEYNPEVKPKRVDKDFPEPWQTLIINFVTMEEYHDFMKKLDKAPVPKLKGFVFEAEETQTGLMKFMGE